MISIFKLNFCLIAAYLLLQTMPGIDQFAALRWVRSFIELNALFTAPGLSLAILLQIILRKRFDFWEFLSIASSAALTIVLLLFLIESTVLQQALWRLGIVNTILITTILSALAIKKRQHFLKYGVIAQPEIPRPLSPLWIIIGLYLAIAAIVALSYSSLLELDPYYWLNQVQLFSNSSTLPDISGRPLFIILTYLINQGAHIDLYATFKYVLPFLSALYLIPAWLVARLFSSYWKQLAILALPLFSPSTILYQQTPFPQQIFILIAWYFVFFLIYSALSKQTLFYFIAGAIVLPGIYIHELFLFIFLTWLGVTLIHYRHYLSRLLIKQPLAALLLLLLVFSNIKILRPIFTILAYWNQRLLVLLANSQTNWLFPAQYTNIDNNAMGWPGALGVSKFYAFYAGPPLILVLLISTALLLHRPAIRKHLSSKEWQVLIIIFIFFFAIAEIIPRVFNIALLPDRAWIMVSIFSAPWLFLILQNYTRKTLPTIPILIIILTIVSISGAIYVNHQKKYVTTQSQLAAADWIVKNLPSQRLFLASGQRNLLSYHAHSNVIITPAQTLCDSTLLSDDALSSLLATSIPSPRSRQSITHQLSQNLEAYITHSSYVSLENVISIAQPYITDLNNLQPNNLDSIKPNLFIFYYRNSDLNPLNERPYIQDAQKKTCSKHILDQHPERFENIYNDGNEVEIWKIL